jgi:predicted  nucleic acid-binding Zn-ribbon protein
MPRKMGNEARTDGVDRVTKMLDPIEEAQRALRDEIAMLREVNRAQADNYASLARQLADREEQLRKAQERIRTLIARSGE